MHVAVVNLMAMGTFFRSNLWHLILTSGTTQIGPRTEMVSIGTRKCQGSQELSRNGASGAGHFLHRQFSRAPQRHRRTDTRLGHWV